MAKRERRKRKRKVLLCANSAEGKKSFLLSPEEEEEEDKKVFRKELAPPLKINGLRKKDLKCKITVTLFLFEKIVV